MYCSKCGRQIDDWAVVCVHCGAATQNMPQQAQADKAAPPQVTIVNTNTNFSASPVCLYSRKSKWATFWLCFFLGWLGIHRLYVGKVGTGILWMFTFGLFGIGWLVDLFVILCNGFSDGFGRPIK